tara:strand:+ start:179 stop:703 length:525 start_codon:yes stop_codon:yes gene_type:complete
MAEIPKGGFDPFDVPIPGESLTDEPGKWPWEQPPKYTDFKETLDVTMERLFKPKRIQKITTMLKAGIPVEAIARTVVFAGFAEGQYTVDVATMMTKTVFEAVLTIGLLAGIDDLQITIDNQFQDEETKFDTDMAKLAAVRKLAKETATEITEEPKKDIGEGLMARPEPKEEETE